MRPNRWSRRWASALTAGLLLGSVLGTAPARAAALVHVDDDGTCAGLSPCFTTIQAGLNNAGPAPAEVRVFPGTYAESVNLALMGSAIAGSPGTLTIRTVNASNVPTAGTATITPAAGSAVFGSLSGTLTIIGISASSPNDTAIDVTATDVVLTDVTSSGGLNGGILVGADGSATLTRVSSTAAFGDDGIDVQVGGLAVVTITDSSSNGNDEGGWNVNFPFGSDGTVVVSGSSGDDNGGAGWNINHGGDGDVTITDSSGDDNGGDGWNVNFGGSGPVSITDVSANANGSTGLDVNNGSPVTIARVSANDNGSDGIDVSASGAVSISDATTSDNGTEGVDVNTDFGMTLARITSLRNLDEGIDTFGSDAIITDSWLQGALDEADGVDLDGGSVSRSIVCENDDEGVDGGDGTVAEGDWWGSTTGPTHILNPGGTGDEADVGDFTPWIDTIGASADAASSGVGSAVRFTFTGGASVLGAGPGDAFGPAPFIVSTSNGTLTSSLGTGASVGARVGAAGTLTVTLTPSSGGTATVTLDGPCGLDRVLAVQVGGAVVTPTVPPTATLSVSAPPAIDAAVGIAIGLGVLVFVASLAGLAGITRRRARAMSQLD